MRKLIEDGSDFRIVGCAYCHEGYTEELGPLIMAVPAGIVSMDVRIEARLHEFCYWRLINIVRAVLGLGTMTREQITGM